MGVEHWLGSEEAVERGLGSNGFFGRERLLKDRFSA